VIFGEILSVHLPSTQRPSRADVASSTLAPKKKKLNFWSTAKTRVGFIFPHFAHSTYFPPLAPISLSVPAIHRPGSRATPSPSPPPSRVSLSPPSRVSISGDPPGTQSILFSDDPPGTQSVQFSGDPRRPVLWQPKRYTCFLGFFFFFILFGYMGERELLWGLSCFGV
jgi:hypothetical protein